MSARIQNQMNASVIEEYRLSKLAVAMVAVGAVVAMAFRIVHAAEAAKLGDLEPMRAIGFAVVFPLALLLPLSRMGPNRTAEGVLMRFGTAVQLVLVAALPRWGLHLALGLPVVFLVVELVETKLPRAFRDLIERTFVDGPR